MPHPTLEEARERYRQRAWSEAHRLLRLADQAQPLAPADLELLATSAYLVGQDTEFHEVLERAHHAWLHQADNGRAARCAFWIALTLLFAGEAGRGNGWLARAQRLVEGRDCVEHGWLLVPAAERHLADHDAGAAQAAARRACEIGERFADADLTACARHVQGRALIEEGRLDDGLRLLDEAMIAVSGGELSPIVTGLIYCSAIQACQRVFATSRAREWTSALARWCARQPALVAFSGTCLVHRAEVMQFRGAWADAMTQAQQAADRGAPGALYRQGEIHRLRGEYAAAETAYRAASRSGAEPQPGLALLRVAQGQAKAAHAAIRRLLGVATDPLERAKLLPAFVEIALATGDLPAARAASDELDAIARGCATGVLRALAAHARGAVDLAEGSARSALGALREALALWQQDDAPYEAARVHLLIALACRQLDDAESAELAFEAARASFEVLGAAPDRERLEALRRQPPRAEAHGLTARELQVLRAVAAGKTNRHIATELFVSERTVDRHVSNLLGKLGVRSRAAATAYAYSHKLI